MLSSVELNCPQSPVSTITPTSFDKVRYVEKLGNACAIPLPWESASKSVNSSAACCLSIGKDMQVTIACPKFSIASTTPTRRRCRKRVSFETDNNGSIVATKHHSNVTAQVDPCQIWWSKEEIMAIHASVFDVCDFFVRFRQDYVVSVVQLLSDCSRSTTSRSRLRRHSNLSDVTNSSCRGLESTVVGMAQHRQARTVAQLLQHQQRLQGVCAEETAHLLALQYRRNTLYAALWAQILADGDAMALDEDEDDDRCLRR